jgi:hypothetical protein
MLVSYQRLRAHVRAIIHTGTMTQTGNSVDSLSMVDVWATTIGLKPEKNVKIYV